MRAFPLREYCDLDVHHDDIRLSQESRYETKNLFDFENNRPGGTHRASVALRTLGDSAGHHGKSWPRAIELCERELESWFLVPQFWPELRDFETFCKWFDWELVDMVYDMEDFPPDWYRF